jgi:hypothetical protein
MLDSFFRGRGYLQGFLIAVYLLIERLIKSKDWKVFSWMNTLRNCFLLAL